MGMIPPNTALSKPDAKPGVTKLDRMDRAIIALLGPIGRILIRSLRVTLVDAHHFTRLIADEQAFLFVIWHSQLLLAVPTAARFRITTLASPTRDGQIGARVASQLGIESITGDSRYHSLGALRRLAKRLREGHSLGLFPDGPAGPARHMKMGPLILARQSGCPLVPAAAAAGWKLESKSHWDRFVLPLPFSRVVPIVGEPVWVPEQADTEEMGRLAVLLEQRMNALGERAEAIIAPRRG